MSASQLLRNLVTAALLSTGVAAATPYVPSSDRQVLERTPARASDPRARELLELRTSWRRDPQNIDIAVQLARRYAELAGAEGDPRYMGYAQAALQPWWEHKDPPLPARVMRAVLRQYDHRFTEAVADLDAAVQADPEQAQAWSWLAAIHLVRADYPRARQACDKLAPLAPMLIATACSSTVESLTGRAAAAAAALHRALRDDNGQAAADQRLWALTRLAEIEERRGAVEAAQAAFRQALALGLPDVYLLAAYADFLLDNGRPAEVLSLLKDPTRADVLLLRLALAAKATNDPRLAGWTRELEARFDAARARGDSTHRKEEARFALAVLAQPERALPLARDNYAQQREVADARLLLEAAWAAKNRDAAAPVLQWMNDSRVESVALKALAERWGPAR